MTVEELVQVLDKKSRFIIRVCHTDKTIFHPVKAIKEYLYNALDKKGMSIG